MKSFKTGLFAVMLMASIAFVSFSSYGATTENESPPDVETVMYDVSVDADVLNVDYEYVSNDLGVIESKHVIDEMFVSHVEQGGFLIMNYGYIYVDDIEAPPSFNTFNYSYNTVAGFKDSPWIKSYSMASNWC